MEQEKHKKKELTDAELKWLSAHFKHTQNSEITSRLGISESTLHRLARKMGLSKSRQYMRKCQLYAAQQAQASHVENGTYPPKGFIIPGSEKYRFRKGESIKDRMSSKRYNEMQEKRRVSWLETRKKDRARFVFGLEQKTGFRYVRQGTPKTNYRYNMKRKGYVTDLEHNVFFYPDEGMRCPVAERNAPKHGIKIMPLSERRCVL